MIAKTQAGLLINYETRGSGTPIVFLHPVGLNGKFWESEMEALESGYRVISIDFRGHGLSEVPTSPFSLEDLADDVKDVLYLANAYPAIVVGLSLGGMVAQILTVRYPEVVSGLVLIDTLYRVNPALAEAFEKRAQKALEQGMKALLDETLERWFSPDFLLFAPSAVSAIRKVLLACNPMVHAWTWRAIKDLEMEGSLADISVPVLVVVGEKDLSTPPSISKEMVNKLKVAQYFEIPGAGHIGVREQPVWFLSRLEGFINGLNIS